MPTECPTCDRTFETTAGMRQHHTKVHGESLPNCECNACGAEFYDPDSARTYCDDCHTTGLRSDRWTHGNTDAECIECGQHFRYYPSEKRGLYCPDCVADASVSCTPPDRDELGTVQSTCGFCESTISVYRSTIETRERVFCDRECYTDWLEARHRERHRSNVDPDQYYTTGWVSARKEALERDEHTCQRCGICAADADRPLEVHHKTPVRMFKFPVDAHTLDNLVTLCRSCHLEVENCD
jgi:hypothetical protein